MLIWLVQWLYFWVDWKSTKVKSVEGKHTASVQTPAPSTEQCQTGVCRCISPALPWLQQPQATAGHRALCSVQEGRERLTCQTVWQALLWVFPGVGCRVVQRCCADCARGMFPLMFLEALPMEKAAACWHRGSCCAFATRVQCWLMVSLVATTSPRSFPAQLGPSGSGPLWTCARDYSCLGAELGVPCYWTSWHSSLPNSTARPGLSKSSTVFWDISHSFQFFIICKLAKFCTLSWHVSH